MGVILDSSVVISAERARQTPADLIRGVLIAVGDQELGLSAIGYTELVHGVHRADTHTRRTLSSSFLAELTSQVIIHPYSAAAAEIAGRIDAEQRLAGLVIPFADLLIGATALSLSFSVLTRNERHFRMIPGLGVLTFS